MKNTIAPIMTISLLLASLIAPVVAAYSPHTGDQFTYYETTHLGGGTGDYYGYSEQATYDGMETVTGINADGTVAAFYRYSYTWSNSSGSTETGSPSGDFTFSPTTFLYVNGTDDQIGYTNPSVWFVMDNSLQVGDTFNLLNTQMTVISRNHSYYLPSQKNYVLTIYAEGSSSYQRDDVYGLFTASYTWQVYFDASSGYIVGYDYYEQDVNPSAGFTYTENFYVNSTSYQLISAPSPTAGQTTFPTPFFTFTPENPTVFLGISFLAVVAFVIVIVVLLIVFVGARGGRRPLSRHAYQHPPSLPGPPPEDFDLTPKQQPSVQQVVVREVVKVKCRYCGALIDSTVETCPICGAPRT